MGPRALSRHNLGPRASFVHGGPYTSFFIRSLIHPVATATLHYDYSQSKKECPLYWKVQVTTEETSTQKEENWLLHIDMVYKEHHFSICSTRRAKNIFKIIMSYNPILLNCKRKTLIVPRTRLESGEVVVMVNFPMLLPHCSKSPNRFVPQCLILNWLRRAFKLACVPGTPSPSFSRRFNMQSKYLPWGHSREPHWAIISLPIE